MGFPNNLWNYLFGGLLQAGTRLSWTGAESLVKPALLFF